jgi:hypothetical protein
MPSDQVLNGATQAAELQVERILRSETFRNAEGLRRLLQFLAERLAAGEADHLKEYSVGVDGLGKPPDYDPRQDSTVRLQVGRLRLKLAEYYMSEGRLDPLIIELPKGHFKLKITPRETVPGADTPAADPARPGRRWLYALGALAAVSFVWAAIATVQLVRQPAAAPPGWTPALEQLWQPFASSSRPVLIAIEDPPFVQFAGYGAYREMALNRWEDIEKSPRVAEIRKLLGNPEISPSYYYAPVGEVSAAFLLGRFLGPRVRAVSLSGFRDLSWHHLASNNVVYVGASVFFLDRFQDLPVQVDFDHTASGVTNARPRSGELEFYPEQGIGDVSPTGERYALVTHIPGPAGGGEIISFTSMRTTGRQGAVQWFIDPANAADLVRRMKRPDGTLPPYYQVLLRVKFKDNVPIETSYVLHHELTARREAP